MFMFDREPSAGVRSVHISVRKPFSLSLRPSLSVIVRQFWDSDWGTGDVVWPLAQVQPGHRWIGPLGGSPLLFGVAELDRLTWLEAPPR